MSAAFLVAILGGLSVASAGCGQAGEGGARRPDGGPSSGAQRGIDGTKGVGPEAGAPIELVDAAGRRHVLEAPARRIVSLVPSATETLRALGADHRLVGVTDYDDWAWAEDLPSVGGGIEPNLEALIALQPDAVVRFAGEQDPRTPARLDALGIRHVAVRPVGLADIYETNRILGALAGRPEAAEALSRRIREGLAELARQVADERRKRVAYLLGGSPPWVSGPATYASEILSLIGGDNVFSDLSRPYAPVSPEELRSREIDVVLLASEGDFDPEVTPGARVEVMGEALDAPGPDVVEGARKVAALLHGRAVR
ncbi:MAG: helical backbone metal receptor [Longimicrobiales bacterium]|nr:helical backbone metal receptor [Longimicrobiales bacterium]